MELEKIFTEENIIGLLSRYRVELARKRSESLFYDGIVKSFKKKIYESEIEQLHVFPPRSTWIRPVLKTRNRLGRTELNRLALELTMKAGLRKKENTPPWAIRLKKFIREVRKNALDSSKYEIAKPKILPIEKVKGEKICRPIAIYAIRDRIIISLYARYIRYIIDSDFLNVSYAFRSNENDRQCPTHHLAIENLNSYRLMHAEDLWVAECDIKKFYDCVNHEIAKNAFKNTLRRIKKKGIEFDKRARRIFNSFLNSYCFNLDVLKKDKKWFTKHGIKGGKFEWVEKELEKLYDEPLEKLRIGIPQGGAISCLIANLILNKADRKLTRLAASTNLFYARYCDDMIIVHNSKRNCREAFTTYSKTLKILKLIMHKPVTIKNYDKGFWDRSIKSKSPYKWKEKKENTSNVPWLSFVGYQLRRDGAIRARPSAITKQIAKQKEIVNKLKFKLGLNEKARIPNNLIKRNKKQILFRLEQKLISMSVGRIFLGEVIRKKAEFCWAAGFKLLNNPRHIKSQLKTLDRNREKLINNMKKKLSTLAVEAKKTKLRIPNIKYTGRPFSYYNQFNRSSNDE